jgi:hypothetical protein
MFCGEVLPILLRRDIEFDKHAADFGYKLSPIFGVNVGDNNLRTLRRKASRDCGPDAACAARDKGRFIP